MYLVSYTIIRDILLIQLINVKEFQETQVELENYEIFGQNM